MISAMRWVCAGIALLLSGCAGFKVVDAPANEDTVQGIRYYEPAPFLLVYSDGKGNLTSQIIVMPDITQKRVIDLYAYASTNKSTLDFTDGMLTKSAVEIDSTAVPLALIDTIQSLGVAAIGAAFNAPESGVTHIIPAPYLFKIVVDANGTTLVGGQGVGPDGKPLNLKISVTKEAATEEDKAESGAPQPPAKPEAAASTEKDD
ncbi:hypothetical protein [Pseudoxanthomonas sacheonensis]|uniref:Type VI secretion system lipoprotein TssJ n=1 Tax=Pseudoxanthomonas sacheonensis TaxID=443615 RepID=A0ABU1RRB8_9GAMM|nr:hypothetical protein [Pseudoxanthomonas sacheonensis]MDR6841323.1 hypothetical protein [Pseudoxanthomonas sacheonensis]